MNLLEKYQSMSDLFSVVKHPDKDIYIVRYHHLGIDWSMENALDARGLVLDKDGNIVARPYKKFFNYKELEDREDLPEEIRQLSDWNNEEYIVQEKSDGSFIMVFVYDDEFIFASSKVFSGEHVDKAKNMFFEQFNEYQIEKIKNEMIYTNASFLFEMIGPSNIHVIEYEKDMLILHDIVPLDSEFYFIEYAGKFAKKFDIPFVKTYNYNLDDLTKLQKEAEGIEGFVVKFKSGKMLKIKTEEYFENSKGIEFFFGRFFTKRKIVNAITAISEGSFDDLIALASNHPRIKENLNEVKEYYDSCVEKLKKLRRLWQSDLFNGLTPKEIGLSDMNDSLKSEIFLARKEESVWLRYIISKALNNFSKKEG